MTEKYTRFITLLKTMFELDKSDLDFGIYRIINIRKEQISDFMDNKLQQKVFAALSGAAVDDKKVNARIAEIEKTAEDMGLAPVDIPKFKEEYAQLKSQLTAGANITELETDVYSALYNFFNRYYDEGDFISKRRYKEGVYAIPYEGEEVKLYWANHDQYYIKSSENFKDYAFNVEDKTVHFRLVDATTETANNKENEKDKRAFMLLEEDFIEETKNELIFKFVYDIPQDKKAKYNEINIERMQSILLGNYKGFWANELLRPVSTDPKKPKSFLQKHYDAYVAKNSFDYFIHKDLKGFLTRELDFFIKSEVMHLDDIDTDNEVRVSAYLAKVKAIKRVGKDIIAFLAQIEDFQKKLWLKKKFVVETNWCITLDKIDEKFYAEIAGNTAQVDEWCKMYAIDEIEGDLTTPGFALPLTIDFLQANKNLVIDTKHFTAEFKDRLIASIDNLDEQTNGLLIHSENFQALNLLQEKYKEQVSGIYIDPPYNTDGMEIIYKNGYKDSSWNSLISDRIKISQRLLTKVGVVCVMIDDVEYANLFKIMNQTLFEYQIRPVIIEYNHRGRVKSNFAYTHEYAVWAIPSGKDLITRQHEISDDIRRNLRRTGTDSTRESSPGMFYGIVVDKATLKIVGVTPALLSGEVIPSDKSDETITIWPIDDAGVERRWYYGHDRIMSDVEMGTVWAKIISGKIQIHYHQDGKPKYRKTLLNGPLMDSSTYGSELLNAIFGLGKADFSFPKSIHAVKECISSMTYNSNATILDYFAGSGTTAHAVINLNREDSGNRKYILVEMGEYFNTVTKPRVQKVIYSADWKNGKPQNRSTGVSQIMKYVRLESYEDTLQNIEMNKDKHDTFSVLGDEYLLSYMLNTESEDSLLNLDLFKSPFSYKLKIAEKNESREKNIDLCETFNFLIGLNVARQSEIKAYVTSPDAADGSYEGAVKLCPDEGGTHAFKMYEGKLRTGEKTLVIWRTMTDNLLLDNAALDAFFAKNFINSADRDFDLIFVNGDNNIENLRVAGETWKINLIELEMKKRMFEGV